MNPPTKDANPKTAEQGIEGPLVAVGESKTSSSKQQGTMDHVGLPATSWQDNLERMPAETTGIPKTEDISKSGLEDSQKTTHNTVPTTGYEREGTTTTHPAVQTDTQHHPLPIPAIQGSRASATTLATQVRFGLPGKTVPTRALDYPILASSNMAPANILSPPSSGASASPIPKQQQFAADTSSESPQSPQRKLAKLAPENHRTAISTLQPHITLPSSLTHGALLVSSETPDGPDTTRVEESHACVACLEEFVATQLIQCPCQAHWYCKEDLGLLFEASLNDTSLFPPRCCGMVIPADIVILSPALVSRFKDKQQELDTSDRTYCHSSACGAWIAPHCIANEVATCPTCQTTTCTLCKGSVHQGTDCPKDPGIQQVLAMANREKWQQCYSCKAVIERQQGCDHMSCHCGAQFCYRCGKPWGIPPEGLEACRCAFRNLDAFPDVFDEEGLADHDAHMAEDENDPREAWEAMALRQMEEDQQLMEERSGRLVARLRAARAVVARLRALLPPADDPERRAAEMALQRAVLHDRRLTADLNFHVVTLQNAWDHRVRAGRQDPLQPAIDAALRQDLRDLGEERALRPARPARVDETLRTTVGGAVLDEENAYLEELLRFERRGVRVPNREEEQVTAQDLGN